MRCAKCEHTWLQQPIKDEDFGDAPSIHQIQDPDAEDNKPSVSAVDTPSDDLESKPNVLQKIRDEIILGYKSVLLGIFIVLVGYGVYAMVSPSIIMGQGLKFSEVEITRDGQDLVVRANIVNTMNGTRGVPSITITTMFEDVVGDTVQFVPPTDVIDPGGSATIEYSIDAVSENVTDIRLGFDAQPSNDH